MDDPGYYNEHHNIFHHYLLSNQKTEVKSLKVAKFAKQDGRRNIKAHHRGKIEGETEARKEPIIVAVAIGPKL